MKRRLGGGKRLRPAFCVWGYVAAGGRPDEMELGSLLTAAASLDVLHASALVPALGPRFAVHGTLGSFVKYGLDPQEPMLKAGRTPLQSGFGEDDPACHAAPGPTRTT